MSVLVVLAWVIPWEAAVIAGCLWLAWRERQT